MNVAPVAVGCSAFTRFAHSSSVPNMPPPLAAQTRCSAWPDRSAIPPLLKSQVQIGVGAAVGLFTHPPDHAPHPTHAAVGIGVGAVGTSGHSAGVGGLVCSTAMSIISSFLRVFRLKAEAARLLVELPDSTNILEWAARGAGG